MSEELLRTEKLLTIKEFNFLLLEVLDRDFPIQQYDLDSICKNASLNFALSFENSLEFLSKILVIKIHDDGSISRTIDELVEENLRGDHALCIFITKKLIQYLIDENLLDKVFNAKIVKFDVHKDTFSININAIPLEYPMIKNYLINMGIAYPEENRRGRILISNIYKHFFQKEILQRVIQEDHLATNDSVDEFMESIKSRCKTLFISYSRNDEKFKIELVKHLSGLKRMGVIDEWNDRAILPGMDWDNIIKEKLELSDMIIFLVSSDFLASDYINDIEIKKSIERYNQKRVIIVPIIVRPCDFASLPISKLQALPRNAKPISRWEDQDEAFLDIVISLKKLIQSE